MEGDAMKTSLRSVTGALVALAVLAACGGGAKRLSKEDFIKTWDAICKTSNAQSDKIGQGLPDQPTQENLSQYADALSQGITILKKEVSDLRKFRPPEADQDTIDGILSNIDQAIAKLEEGQQAAASGDLAGFNSAIQEATPIVNAANDAANAYGFQECGRV
jgi:hypothetical protein